jgi:hypothetical protein
MAEDLRSGSGILFSSPENWCWPMLDTAIRRGPPSPLLLHSIEKAKFKYKFPHINPSKQST